MWGFLGGLASGIGSWLGSRASAKSAEDINQAQIGEAEKQREFQLMMSNTAHQREVKDLLAAGLNPILSVNSGAPMGVGAQASLINPGESFAETGRNIGDSVNKMVSTSKAWAETKAMQATARQNNATAKQAENEAYLSSQKIEYLKQHPELIGAMVAGEAINVRNLPGIAVTGLTGIAQTAKEGIKQGFGRISSGAKGMWNKYVDWLGSGKYFKNWKK